MNNWYDEMQDAAREIDNHLGAEPFMLIPYQHDAINVNAQPVTDKTREKYIACGIYSNRAQMVNLATLSVGVQMTDPYVCFRFEVIQQWRPQRMDRLVRQCDGSIFTVTSVEPDGVSSVKVNLQQGGLTKADLEKRLKSAQHVTADKMVTL